METEASRSWLWLQIRATPCEVVAFIVLSLLAGCGPHVNPKTATSRRQAAEVAENTVIELHLKLNAFVVDHGRIPKDVLEVKPAELHWTDGYSAKGLSVDLRTYDSVHLDAGSITLKPDDPEFPEIHYDIASGKFDRSGYPR
ncbi:MAG: hypothetical protein IPP14_09090 [Planctomycetes bacterium]|nr:hypothetical protein [Planctomycetota bacterium]